MSAVASGKPKKRDRSNENFKKRWNTLVKSGCGVHEDYRADVYILLRRNGRIFEFKSTDKAWPLSAEEIVRHTPRRGNLRAIANNQ